MLCRFTEYVPIGHQVMISQVSAEDARIVSPTGLEVRQNELNLFSVVSCGPLVAQVRPGDLVSMTRMAVAVEKFTPVFAANESGGTSVYYFIHESDLAGLVRNEKPKEPKLRAVSA